MPSTTKRSPFIEKLRYLSKNTLLCSKIFLLLAFFALCCRTLARISPDFADFFNRYIASVFRFVLASVSDILPFSLAEIIVILLPIVFVIIVALAFRFSKTREKTVLYIMFILSLVALFYFLFVFTFAVGYHTNGIDEAFQLERSEISVSELKETTLWLGQRAGELADEALFEGNSSKMPFTWEEMNEKLNSAFYKVNSELDLLFNYNTRAKPIMLSRPMTYTGILGVYTFFTGEANVNTTFPDYTTVFTAAHEMSHQRGVAREDEANFLAFVVCSFSEDDYIKYAGYVNMLEYMLNALSSASPSEYATTLSALPKSVLREIVGYAQIYDEYDDTPVGDVSQAVNDTYLKVQGTEGTRSYGMVVDLAVAYYKSQTGKR